MLNGVTFNAGKKTAATHGTVQVPFSVLFNDTIEVHGLEFARSFYVEKNGMDGKEFSFWLGAGWIAEPEVAVPVWGLWELEALQA
jgi:hypothetical protein